MRVPMLFRSRLQEAKPGKYQMLAEVVNGSIILTPYDGLSGWLDSDKRMVFFDIDREMLDALVKEETK